MPRWNGPVAIAVAECMLAWLLLLLSVSLDWLTCCCCYRIHFFSFIVVAERLDGMVLLLVVVLRSSLEWFCCCCCCRVPCRNGLSLFLLPRLSGPVTVVARQVTLVIAVGGGAGREKNTICFKALVPIHQGGNKELRL